jgi:hypothetical protein
VPIRLVTPLLMNSVALSTIAGSKLHMKNIAKHEIPKNGRAFAARMSLDSVWPKPWNGLEDIVLWRERSGVGREIINCS